MALTSAPYLGKNYSIWTKPLKGPNIANLTQHKRLQEQKSQLLETYKSKKNYTYKIILINDCIKILKFQNY